MHFTAVHCQCWAVLRPRWQVGVLVPAPVLALPWLRCFGVGTQATHRCCIPSGRRRAGRLREASCPVGARL